MPPVVSSDAPYSPSVQPGYGGQAYPPMPQANIGPGQVSAAAFQSPSYSQTPYGPPPAQSQPLYGGMAPGTLAGVPADPYAWQRGAVQQSQPMSPQYQSPNYQYPQPVAPGYQPQQTMQPGYYPPQTQAVQQPYQAQAYGYAQPTPQQAYGPQRQQGYGGYQAKRQAPKGMMQVLARLFGNKRNVIAGGVGGMAILLVVGLTIATNGSGKTSSNTISIGHDSSAVTKDSVQLFQTALGNALQTKNYDQKVTGGSHPLERKVDVSNVKAPRISGSASVTDTGSQLTAYATRDDTFVNLSKAAILAGHTDLANKWVQVRKAGTSLDMSGTGGASLDMLFTPTTALYNGFIFGAYGAADRDALLGIIKDQLVYRFDPSQVTQGTVGGQSVSQYQVTVSSSGQQALSAKAASLAGVDQQRISQAATIARLSGSANGQLTVSVSNREQRIVQVKRGGDNGETATYSAYDITQVVSKAPQPEFTWDEYTGRITGR